MTDTQFISICKKQVAEYFNGERDATDKNGSITEENVFVVWVCKALQNWKALASTTVADGMYYELTYNGDKKQLYLDAYKKWKNKCIEVAE